ncbi:hypothetical protein [Streptomyces sp. NPDC047315]|uniref:hypothetical protein n=1 Tax=Streptomyces sp. NPDC047315 TaxID=3155142 RepID=UPI0033C91DEB
MSRVVLPAALALAVTAAGATYVKNAASGADRSPATKTWAQGPVDPVDDPAGDPARGRAATPLSKQLLPVPNLYKLGPDQRNHGSNDGELSGARATERLKRAGAEGMTRSERRKSDRAVDGLEVEGIAWRTYASSQFTHVVEVDLLRLKDPEKARLMFLIQAGVFAKLKNPEGPKVEGHERSSICFADKPEKKNDLREYFCTGYAAGTNMTVRVYGSAKLSASDVGDFVKQQMDRITSPEEAV